MVPTHWMGIRVAALIGMALVLILGGGSAQAAEINPSPPRLLNTDGATDVAGVNSSLYDSDVLPQILSDGAGTWIAVWMSSISYQEGRPIGACVSECECDDPDIYFARSMDNGASWSSPALIDINGEIDCEYNFYPYIRTDGMGVWIVVWVTGNGNSIARSISTDNGQSWGIPTLIQIEFGYYDYPQLAADSSGNWIEVWQSDGDSLGGVYDSDISFVRSTDNGASWSAPNLINSNATIDLGQERHPQIATDSAGNWIAVWISTWEVVGDNWYEGVFYALSSDNGQSWSPPVLLDSNVSRYKYYYLRLETDGAGNWIAVWSNSGGNGGVYIARSSDNGLSWSAPGLFNTNGGHLELKADGAGNWVAVWFNTPDSISLVRSTDDGVSWSEPVLLNATVNYYYEITGDLVYPQLTTDDAGNWMVVWSGWGQASDTGEDYDIFYTTFKLGDTQTSDGNCDYSISLSELLRVIQFYNVGALHCDLLAEDSFNPGVGDTTCVPHTSDYNSQDWSISFSELLRLIQLYNALGYYPCPGVGEDEFCPGTA